MRAAALGGLALALAACPRADAPPPAAPKGPTACERAADSMVGAMLAHLPASDAPTEQADALRRLIRVRCEQDGWSAESTRCLIAMRKLVDAEPCARLMPDDQQEALARDLEARSGARPAGRPGGGTDGAGSPRSGPSGDTGGSGHPGGGTDGAAGPRSGPSGDTGGSGHPGGAPDGAAGPRSGPSGTSGDTGGSGHPGGAAGPRSGPSGTSGDTGGSGHPGGGR